MINIFRENKNIFIFALAVIILLIFLHSFNLLSPAEKVITSALKPVQNFMAGRANTVKSFFSQISSLNNLSRENEALKQEITRLKAEKSAVSTLIEENKLIEPQILALQEKNYQYVLARVISKGVDPTFKTMMINQGTDQGLKEGLPVVTEETVIIGKIIKTEANRSQVMLLNDTRSATASQIQNQDSTQGLVTGEFGLALKMEFIPKEERIEIGQTVITSGLENLIPKGLIIGEIESIKVQAGDFFQTAYLKPLTEYDKIQIVSVITGF